MSTFRTPKGTELPFLDLKGKKYLQIMHRLIWFREEKPMWSIVTKIISVDSEMAVVEASVADESGRLISRGHKMQTAKGFPAYLEKAESAAVGRALAFLGYGTAHAQELEEDEETQLSHLPDSPMPPKQNGYIVPFGKFKGLNLSKVPVKDLKNYVDYLQKGSADSGKPLDGIFLKFVEEVAKLSS